MPVLDEGELSYADKMKNNCFVCRLWFQNRWRHYRCYGNACPTCCGRIMRVKNVKTLYRRRFSKDESSYYLALRRKWVIDNHLYLPPGDRPKGFTPALPPKEI